MDYNVSEFFKTDLPAYGQYDNCRKISSYIDGLKLSSRKIVYTFLKKYPGKDKIKTETVANVTAAFTNYLHGSGNISSVCGTLAQAFVGANNYPLLDGNSGGFGTRINSTVAAPRYTKVALAEIIQKMLNQYDADILDYQFFEGSWIEPKYFVPVFPILLLNGSEGLSTGFSQNILPRNPLEVIEYIKKKISGTVKPRMQLLPWFKGHLGKVEKNVETGAVESFGVITKNNMTSYTITEIPIGVEYQKYVNYLDKLCDNGTIQDYDDECDPKTDTICFKVKTSREFTRKHEDERRLLEVFKLVKSLPEVLTCIDENSRVKEYSCIQDILDDFITVRLRYYDIRKKHILDVIQKSLELLQSKWLFCDGIIKKTIKVANVKKDDIIKQLEKVPAIKKIDGDYMYLLRIPIYLVTKEKIEELKKQIDEQKAEYKKVQATSINNMWLADLAELKKSL